MTNENAALAIDGGDLALGGGLLALVRPALDLLEPGGVLAVNSINRALRDDLPRWCQLQHHAYCERQSTEQGYDRHIIARGGLSVPHGRREQDVLLPQTDGKISADDVLKSFPMPEHADPSSGFAPRGARVEPGGPRNPFTLIDRDHVAPPEVAKLYDRAVSAQWNANTDIPWHKTPRLPPELQRAIGQVFTFLAETDLSALYLPSKFVSRIHPAYAETAMFLSTQMADEAAVRRRAATLAGVGGAPEPLQDGLTVLAAGSTGVKAIARGHDAFRELLLTMHASRVKRLTHAGFTEQQAQTLSDLHTPNFM